MLFYADAKNTFFVLIQGTYILILSHTKKGDMHTMICKIQMLDQMFKW